MVAPSSLAELVRDRTAALRTVPFADLVRRKRTASEDARLGWRRGSLEVLVESQDTDAVRVIVLGSLQIPLLPVYTRAVDGFYKRADGTVGAVPDEEFREFE